MIKRLATWIYILVFPVQLLSQVQEVARDTFFYSDNTGSVLHSSDETIKIQVDRSGRPMPCLRCLEHDSSYVVAGFEMVTRIADEPYHLKSSSSEIGYDIFKVIGDKWGRLNKEAPDSGQTPIIFQKIMVFKNGKRVKVPPLVMVWAKGESKVRDKLFREAEAFFRRMSEHIYFEHNSSKIQPESNEYLDSIVLFLNWNPHKHLKITGHADTTGNEERNNVLAGERAVSVADYLSDHGIDKSRLTTEGLGSLMNVFSDVGVASGRKRGRRVEFQYYSYLEKE